MVLFLLMFGLIIVSAFIILAKNKIHGKKIALIIGVAIVVSGLLGGGLIYKFGNKNPKTAIKRIITKLGFKFYIIISQQLAFQNYLLVQTRNTDLTCSISLSLSGIT